MRNPFSFETVYREIDKIDAHVHLNCTRPDLQKEADSEGFGLVTINTEVPDFPDTDIQREIAVKNAEEKPGNLHFIATFSTEGWGQPWWADRAMAQIEEGMDGGAVAVKIWKNIGMVLQDEKSRYIMADHPSFDPVYEYLATNEIPLLAHLGEPKNCWLPIEEMTVTSDRQYFSTHPQYHMALHDECPSYEKQLEARDRVLAKHKSLVFIGAHLASLEWSVNRLAEWLENHPRCGVDLAERVCHLQYQAVEHHGKVRQFIEKYQDRILYGTDQIDDGSMAGQEIRNQIREKWHSEFRFFAEDSTQTTWNVEKPFRGLGLGKNILKKLFRENAIRYYPRLKDRM
ncbi:MAG: amidohydrolase family protein [Balneolaceae bacterium]